VDQIVIQGAIQDSLILKNHQKLCQSVQMMAQGAAVKRFISKNQEVKELVDAASGKGLMMKTSDW